MTDPRLSWTLFVPLVAAAIAGALVATEARGWLPAPYRRWARLLALVASVAGLLVEGLLAAVATGTGSPGSLGIDLRMSQSARFVLLAANVSLLLAVLFDWGERRVEGVAPRPEWALILAPVTASLLAGAALATSTLVQALCLLGAGVVAGAVAAARPSGSFPGEDDVAARQALALRVAGGLKHVSMAALATVLLVAGALLVARYSFNLENVGLLRLGVALLALGLIARAGAMPFAAAHADLLAACPSGALVALGAGVPVTLVAGLAMLAPVEQAGAGSSGAAWLAPLAALLAGLRALGAVAEARRPEPMAAERGAALLGAMSVAVATAWAVFGALGGSPEGGLGAALIALNIALAVPLLLLGNVGPWSRWSRWSRWLGAGSLIGLPPLGGFGGTMLVAQSAANAGGLWLAMLVAGSLLVAAAWLAYEGRTTKSEGDLELTSRQWRDALRDPRAVASVALVAAQITLFAAAGPMATLLGR